MNKSLFELSFYSVDDRQYWRNSTLLSPEYILDNRQLAKLKFTFASIPPVFSPITGESLIGDDPVTPKI